MAGRHRRVLTPDEVTKKDDYSQQRDKERKSQGYSGPIKDTTGKPMDNTPEAKTGGGRLIRGGGVGPVEQFRRKIDGWNGKD